MNRYPAIWKTTLALLTLLLSSSILLKAKTMIIGSGGAPGEGLSGDITVSSWTRSDFPDETGRDNRYMFVGTLSGNRGGVRGQLSFDLSRIPDGATITSATVSLYQDGYDGGANNPSRSVNVEIASMTGPPTTEMSWNDVLPLRGSVLATVTGDPSVTTPNLEFKFLSSALTQYVRESISSKQLNLEVTSTALEAASDSASNEWFTLMGIADGGQGAGRNSSSPISPSLTVEYTGGTEVLASVSNDQLELQFVCVTDPTREEKQIYSRYRVNCGDEWLGLPANEDENFFLLESSSNSLIPSIYPKWSTNTNGDRDNPFFAATRTEFRMTGVKVLSDSVIQSVAHSNDNSKAITTTWELVPGSRSVKATAAYTASEEKFTSIGYSAGHAMNRSDIEAVQMPPMYQMRRLHPAAKMFRSYNMPVPISMVQVEIDSKRFTWSVAGDPEMLPFDGGSDHGFMTPEQSPYGFAIVNGDGNVQPTIFTPILGYADSDCSPGTKLERKFVVDIHPGEWGDALRGINERIFEVQDYRQPHNASLSDSILNMFDLIKNHDISGFFEERKAFDNIEHIHESTSSGHLMTMSAALLSRDEAIYEGLALPHLEFILSRYVFHFSDKTTNQNRMAIGSDRWGRLITPPLTCS